MTPYALAPVMLCAAWWEAWWLALGPIFPLVRREGARD